MKLISSSYGNFYRILSLLWALHFLNLSIDSKDPKLDSFPEDLTFNDIESITEFFAEVVFGWHDAFQEHEEHDSEDGGSIDFYKFYVSKTAETITSNKDVRQTSNYLTRNSTDILAPVKDIHSPPPRG